MQYDFDTVIHRTRTASLKWDILHDKFGTDDVLPMWVADMDFRSPAPVIEALRQRVEHGVFGYTLRETYYDALADWLRRRHHFTVKPNWLVHTQGVVPALGLIIEAFTKPDDGVLIQPPVYYPFANLISRNNRRLVCNQLKFDGHRYTMDFDALEQALQHGGTKLMIFCSPHNPVGRVWTPQELTNLGDMCQRHGVLIVSDEIHSDLTLLGHRHTPFASINSAFAEQSITCVAPSKTFNLPGLQMSTVIIPNDSIRRGFQSTAQRLAVGSANVFGVVAADSAYRHGEEWLNQLLQYLDGNIDYLKRYVATYIPDLKVIEPEGTYLVWIDCSALGMKDGELERLFVREAKVAPDMGTMFGSGGEGFVRMNVACPRSVLEQALGQIKTAVTRYTSERTRESSKYSDDHK